MLRRWGWLWIDEPRVLYFGARARAVFTVPHCSCAKRRAVLFSIMTQTQVSSSLSDCIRSCEECHRICMETLSHCLDKGGSHAEAGHIGLLLDCVEICQTSANFMVRDSDLHTETCRACAVICQRCAESCEKMSGDEQMKRCAEACRQCAESCKGMSGSSRR